MTRAAWQWKWVALGSVVIVAVVVLGMWRAGWWFAEQNVNNQGHVIQNGYPNQVSLDSQIHDDWTTITSENVQLATVTGGQRKAILAQRLSTADDLCFKASQVNPAVPLPPDEAAFVKANCSGGTVSARSPLQK